VGDLLEQLKRDEKRKGVRINAIGGIALVVCAVALIALGLTFEEPNERISTKPVPQGAELALIIGGGIVGIVGLRMISKAVRAAAGTKE
jgi:hypothetical protein